MSIIEEKKKPCGLNAVKDCIHWYHRAAKQSERDVMYKKELKKLHYKLREFSRRLKLIEEVNLLKHEMRLLANSDTIPYKAICTNYRYKDKLEQLFNLPFHEIRDAYCEMLDERNRICHRYTLGFEKYFPSFYSPANQ